MILLRMSEPFGLREAFHVYPLIKFLIMAIGYWLLMVPFVLALVSRRGRRIVVRVLGASQASGCLFVCFEQTNIKTQKKGLHTNLLLTYDWQFCSPIILNPSILLFHDDSYYGNYNE